MVMYWIGMFFLFGIVLGSFFNVVGIRVPKRISFHQDRSFCPTCNNQLCWYELIPILSYLIQRGKCRNCKETISPIYPIIEIFTGLLFAFSYVQIGLKLELITALLLISMLMILFVSDLVYMVIPNKILVFFLPYFIIMRIISPLVPWYDAILGSVVGYLLIAIIILVSQGGMGAGDMKLFGVLGIILGWKQVLLTFFLAASLGAIIGGILLMLNKVKKKQPIPFGPYIVVGALISYFYGEEILIFYLSFFEKL
ncbi:prepilin peptidase [Pseudogracilibacillus sp. SE30717A]|uniref:prepilin peptidase n=1 Tax=Pseudogracilibacillus sp. SE30717A TaxID=3098293 RepID=UPI00300E3E33